MINVSHFEYARYSSDRLHRALGCGALVLNKNFPKQELDFPSMIGWDTIKELKQRIKDILYKGESEINKYHKNITCEFAHKYLTWDYLINKLVDELDREH